MLETVRVGAAARQVLKAALPPVLVHAYKARRRRYYPSFAAATKASSGTWQSGALTQFRIEEAVQNLPVLQSKDLPQGYALLLATTALLQLSRPRICDLGGGCGAWGYLLRKDVDRPFDYIVVEDESLVAACSDHHFFSWASWQRQLPQDYDVFVCSGTLQYLEQPYELLRQALTRTKRHAIITRTTFSEKDYVQVQVSTLQHNGHYPKVPPGYEPNQHIHYPHRTVRLSEVLAIADQTGFDVHLKLHPTSSSLAPGAFEQDMVLTRRA